MIFITVGHQMPFDRLIRLVDRWAEKCARRDLFAQIGQASYRPRHFPSAEFLGDAQFERMISDCTAVVAHAGTGSILRALTIGKPMLVLPRLSRLGETRNDHQVGTAQHFASAGQLLMANDDEHLLQQLDAVEAFQPKCRVSSSASQPLLSTIRRFIDTEEAWTAEDLAEDREDARPL